jgi:hypothetical protein
MTRNEIINSAMRLCWRRGRGSSGLDDLATGAHVAATDGGGWAFHERADVVPLPVLSLWQLTCRLDGGFLPGFTVEGRNG